MVLLATRGLIACLAVVVACSSAGCDRFQPQRHSPAAAGGPAFSPTPAAGEVAGSNSEIPQVLWNAYFGDSLPGLGLSEQTSFQRGQQIFVKLWRRDEGLGPITSAVSCVACHRIPVPGGAGTTQDTFVFHVPNYRDGSGGDIFGKFEITSEGKLLPRPIPSFRTIRKTPALYGLGLLEGVSDASIESNRARTRTKGRVVRVEGYVGRFGWKASSPSLRDFVARALLTEMGLTTTQFSDEINGKAKSGVPEVSDAEVSELTEYVRLLAVPPPEKAGKRTELGETQFTACGCATCHVPLLESKMIVQGSLRTFIIRPYSDLLVHNMGSSFDNGERTIGVLPSEFRTAPLWGVWASGPPYLHDCRAKDLQEAVELHDGEARDAAEAFKALPESDKRVLLDFVKAL